MGLRRLALVRQEFVKALGLRSRLRKAGWLELEPLPGEREPGRPTTLTTKLQWRSMSLRAGAGFVLRWLASALCGPLWPQRSGGPLSHGRSERRCGAICYFAVYAIGNRRGLHDAAAHGAVAFTEVAEASGHRCCRGG
jgi:hypothetical protein